MPKAREVIRARIVENVYRRHIWLLATDRRSVADAFFEKMFPGRVEPLTPTTTGKTCYGASGDIAVWLMDPEDTSTLVHELSHVVSEILTSRGIPLGPDTDEAYAYLTQSLFIAMSLELGKPPRHIWGRRASSKA